MSEQPQDQHIDVNRLFLTIVKLLGPLEFGVDELQDAYTSIGEDDGLSMLQDEDTGRIGIEYVEQAIEYDV